jgi:nucleoside-diphosphate-sugar epimerase
MKITIIGCGWLGFPLAQELFNKDHVVYGSTTRNEKLVELQNTGIIPFLYDGLRNVRLPADALSSDLLILNFPPGRSMNYPNQVKSILDQLKNETKVIFTSSTGVYEDVEGEVEETSSLKSDHTVALAEKIVKDSGRRYCVLRLAGLMGGNRHPVNYLSGRTVEDGNMAVNMVHREDVIGAILAVINSDKWNRIYNVVFPEHPTKSEYYSRSARDLGIPEPNFEFSVKKGKTVSGKKIEDDLGFVYDHHI